MAGRGAIDPNRFGGGGIVPGMNDMPDLFEDVDTVTALVERARGGEFHAVVPELTQVVRETPSIRAMLGAATALTDILVWTDSMIATASTIAEAALDAACHDADWALVRSWSGLVEVIVGAQAIGDVPARPRLLQLHERAARGGASPAVLEFLERKLKLDVPDAGAPPDWRSYISRRALREAMAPRFYDEFKAGPAAWSDDVTDRLWSLLVDYREGPEIAAGLLAAGAEPAPRQGRTWRWLIGRFLAAGERGRASWALHRYLAGWVDEPFSVLPRQLPLHPYLRPVLDDEVRRQVLAAPIGPAERRPTPDTPLTRQAVERRRIDAALRARCDLGAACVTVVVGSTPEQVLVAFGADPGMPAVPPALAGETAVSVFASAGAVIAVEDNGFRGSMPAVLAAASAGGRAASYYWNDVGDTAIGFAAGGLVIDSGDYLLGRETLEDPELAAVVAEIAMTVDDAGLVGLLAVERFTGARIEDPGPAVPALAHRIVDRPRS